MTTVMEALMLLKIAKSEFSNVNGADPESLEDIGRIWADTVIETAEDKGVFTSLLKKGLVFHTGPNDPDAWCGLTVYGFDEYKKSIKEFI